MASNAAPGNPTRSILVVEDDPHDARVTFGALRASGRFTPHHVRTAGEALAAAAGTDFDAYLVDYRLPDMSGVELCRRLRLAGAASPLVLLSSVMSDSVVERAQAVGVADFMLKQIGYGERLVADLDRVLGA